MKEVLIVDDEPRAITAMKYVIDWSQYGYEVTGEALNGRQAIELLKQRSFSLMITDIRMPGLSGLALIEEIRTFSDVPIIVMSGHQDFQYAKECLRFGVKEYLLKPVAGEDLGKLLMSINEEIDQANLLKSKLSLSIPVIKEQVLKRWAHGHLDHGQLLTQLKTVGIEPDLSMRYRVLLAEMDTVYHLHSYWTESELFTRRTAVRNVIEETIDNCGYVVEESEERLLIIIHEKSAAENSLSIEALSNEIIANVETFTKVSLTLSAGVTVRHYQGLRESYKSACRLMERKFWSSSKLIVSNDHSEHAAGKMEQGDIRYIHAVMTAVKQKDTLLVEQILHQQKEIFIQNQTQRSIVQATVYEVLFSLHRLILDSNGEYEVLLNAGTSEYTYISESNSLEDIMNLLIIKCQKTIEYLREQKLSQPQKTVRLLKQIAEERYREDLSLRSIGLQIHVNPVYLGQIFKATEGIAFNDYLLQIRMERAKHLLLSTDMKVYEVVTEVGYQEVDWFYRKFKEYTGYSTKEYREGVL